MKEKDLLREEMEFEVWLDSIEYYELTRGR